MSSSHIDKIYSGCDVMTEKECLKKIRQFLNEIKPSKANGFNTIVGNYRDKNNCLCKHIKQFVEHKEWPSDVNDERLLEYILECMNEMLSSIPASRTSYKKNLYELFISWAEQIADNRNIEFTEDLRNILEDPFVPDFGVELLKMLHDRNGVTNEKIGEKLGVKEKSVRSYLQSLDPSIGENVTRDSLHSHRQKYELRFGGQLLNVNIETKKSQSEKRKKHYYTPNTIHPIALQMNVTQIATLLHSLQKSYKCENSIVSKTLAVNIWSQLSDYGKGRMKDVFVKRKYLDDVFLQELEADTQYFETGFENEVNMINSDMKIEDILDIYGKAERQCSIQLKDGIIYEDVFARRYDKKVQITKVDTNESIEINIGDVVDIW